MNQRDTALDWPKLSNADGHGRERAKAAELPTLILLRVGARLVAAPYARGLSKPAQIALAAVRDELRYRHVRLPDLGLRGSHDRAGARRALTFTVT